MIVAVLLISIVLFICSAALLLIWRDMATYMTTLTRREYLVTHLITAVLIVVTACLVGVSLLLWLAQ